jgi:excisionase family DNA binding protein
VPLIAIYELFTIRRAQRGEAYVREKEFFREQLALINEVYPDKITLTVSEAAKILGVERRTVVRLIERKRLPASNVCKGKRYKVYLIPKTAVARFASGE